MYSYNTDLCTFQGDGQSERMLLSRYGIWLLVELCKHKEVLEIEVLGRLLSMLFQVEN